MLVRSGGRMVLGLREEETPLTSVWDHTYMPGFFHRQNIIAARTLPLYHTDTTTWVDCVQCSSV